MKIAIMGAGGLGCYFGGQLARAGNEVVFVARGAQLTALQEQGLQVESVLEKFHIDPVQATDNPATIGPVDLILLCVKTYDVVSAAEAMRPMLGPQTAIIPVLNGIEHVEILGELLGIEHILGGQATVTAHVKSPGMVERVGGHCVVEFGEVAGGLSDRVRGDRASTCRQRDQQNRSGRHQRVHLEKVCDDLRRGSL